MVTIFWISCHIFINPSHSYKRWSKISTCIQHILHFPSDNDILCKRLPVFIWKWNTFQLRSLHCLGNKSLTKLFSNQTIHLLSILSNLCSQYSFEGIWTVLLYETMLYRSFDDNLFKGFGNLNVASNIARSYGFPFSFKIKDLKQPCEKHVFIVCISSIYPALFFNLWKISFCWIFSLEQYIFVSPYYFAAIIFHHPAFSLVLENLKYTLYKTGECSPYW